MTPSSTISYLTDIYLGQGAVQYVAGLLSDWGCQRPLVVTDRGLVELGGVDRLGIEGVVYDEVETNPTEDQARACLEVFRGGDCDALVALGGGSSIDLAKCVGILVGHEGPLERYAILHGGIPKIQNPLPPLLAVPTTAGSGSEVGRAALLTLTSGDKMGFLSPFLIPKAAVCDPELTVSLPRALTAGTGMDAISHCVETFCSTRFNPVADAIALDGLVRGCNHILAVTENGGYLEGRREMVLCSLEGGLAFQKSLGAVHSLSHPLGALTERGLHHGTLNALFLPAVLRFNFDTCPEKMKAMAGRLGLCGSELPEYFEGLNERLGLPKTLAEMGLTADVVEPLAEKAAGDHCSPTNPRALDAAACLALYTEVL